MVCRHTTKKKAVKAFHPQEGAEGKIGASVLVSKLQSCGTIEYGISVSVSAKKVNCPSARKIVRKWNRKVPLTEPPPRFTRVKNFPCEFTASGPYGANLNLRCKNENDSRKRVHADWGD